MPFIHTREDGGNDPLRATKCAECKERRDRHADSCPNKPRVPACHVCGKRGLHHDRCPERPPPGGGIDG